MSRKAKSSRVDEAVAAITISSGLLDELVKEPMTATQVQAVHAAALESGIPL